LRFEKARWIWGRMSIARSFSPSIWGGVRSSALSSATRNFTIIPAEEAAIALEGRVKELSDEYGAAFNRHSFGLSLKGNLWRAGLAFLPGPQDVSKFAWPVEGPARVIVLKSTGAISRFLKKEESADEERITFGDPTQAVDEALSASAGGRIRSTSRLGTTVRGVLA